MIVAFDVPCIMEELEFEDFGAVGSPYGKCGVYLNVWACHALETFNNKQESEGIL